MLIVTQDILVFVLAQEPMVDEDTREVLADRLVEEDCRHRGVDPARESQDDLVITSWARSSATVLSTKEAGDQLPRIPVTLRKLSRILRPSSEWNASGWTGPPRTLAIDTEGCCLYVLGAGDDTEALRERGDGVTVGHPYDTARCDTLEELIILVA